MESEAGLVESVGDVPDYHRTQHHKLGNLSKTSVADQNTDPDPEKLNLKTGSES